MKLLAGFFSLPPWLKQIVADPFQRYLYLIPIALGFFLLLLPQKQPPIPEFTTKDTIHFFHHPTCPPCREQKQFNHYLIAKYPQLSLISHDTSLSDEAILLINIAERMGVERSRRKDGCKQSSARTAKA